MRSYFWTGRTSSSTLGPSHRDFKSFLLTLQDPASTMSKMLSKVQPLKLLPQTDSGYSSLAATPEDEAPPSPHLTNPSHFPFPDFSIIGTVVCEPEGRIYKGQDASFTIQLGPNGHLNLSSVTTFVTGPSGHRCTVKLEEEAQRFVCVFHPLENGLHVGSVFIGPFHLPGSPFHVVVERNYENSIGRPIISMDMEVCSLEERFKVRKPWGITCNTSNEQILVTDREYHEVLIYAPEGDWIGSFGGHGVNPGLFSRPTGIAYDALHDRILVTDKDNHRVQFFTPGGTFLGLFGGVGKSPGQFSYPWGIAVSKYGLILVSDSRNHRLQLFDSVGSFIRKFQPRLHSPIAFNFPRGVAFSLNGEEVYVTDFNNHVVFKLSLDFRDCTTLVSKDLRRPSGIAVDDSGNILVADTRNNAVKVFSPDGDLLHSIKRLDYVQLDLPTDIAVCKAGFVGIADFNGRISVV